MRELPIRRGPFGLPTLEEAYQSIVYGYDEPDKLNCSQKTRDRIVGLCRYQPINGVPMFNNAVIVVDETLPDSRVRFTNSKYPNAPIDVVDLRSPLTLDYDKMNVEVEFTDA